MTGSVAQAVDAAPPGPARFEYSLGVDAAQGELHVLLACVRPGRRTVSQHVTLPLQGAAERMPAFAAAAAAWFEEAKGFNT